jgi:hypothetical protein
MNELSSAIKEYTSTHFYINFVSTQHNGDVLAYTLKVTMPIGNVFVCNTRGDVKHDDTALALNVITITETTKLFLSGGVPDIETDGAKVGRELQWVHFDTEGGCKRRCKWTVRQIIDREWWVTRNLRR